MAALVTALDNLTPKQFGENGHIEYGWSNSIQERIVQFNFQVSRTQYPGPLESELDSMLDFLSQEVKNGTLPERQIALGYLSILYKMIGYTRDIIDGKGECALTYMMIYVWNSYYPSLSEFALKCLVDLGDKNVHQYGSWKDIKYFCKYIKDRTTNYADHNLVRYSVQITNEQIRNDMSTTDNISLVAKWAPREKSSFGWLFDMLAVDYFQNIMLTANTNERKQRAFLKCKTDYRKILSSLNKRLDTVQIKQCDRNWSEIDFNNATSITLTKQKKAFLNIKKDGTIRFSDDADRVQCAEHFKTHIENAITGEVEMKGKRVSMGDFTKQAMDLHNNRGTQLEKDLLNSQWRDNSRKTSALGNMIAMVDVSGSMSGEPMEVAIALGIRIAEKSAIGKRVMTFTSTPSWVNLEPFDDFVSQVGVIQRAPWGMTTNFSAALDTILDAIIENKMAPEDVQNMVLVILSDMQMDVGDRCDKNALYETMKAKYAAAGIRVHGTAYRPPHILFWNLRSTSGFPTLSNQPNASMMSGFSPTLLNLFCDQGIEALQSCTPWSFLNTALENERYKIMNERLYQAIDV